MNSSDRLRLYDKENIQDIVLPKSESADLAMAYWLPMMRVGSAAYINNVHAQLYLLVIDDVVLPITVNDETYENSYVCSFYSHYITYAKEELRTLQSPKLEVLLAQLIDSVGYLLKATCINQAVIVNNWMLSTNLYPDLSAQQLDEITNFLKQVFPKHAIAFRSINESTESSIKADLKVLGYQMVGSRQVYLYDSQHPTLCANRQRRRTRYLKQDRKLFETTGYQVVDAGDIRSEEIHRIIELYNLLYLEKYSYNNPQFSENFIAQACALATCQRSIGQKRHEWESHLPFLEIQALRKNGRIDAVVGFYIANGVMTTPLLGYDTHLPKQLGLYRMLTACIINAGERRGLLINQSSGAADFKRRRGFSSCVEYSAVWHRHLPLYRRVGWWFLGAVVQAIAIPLMKYYKL